MLSRLLEMGSPAHRLLQALVHSFYRTGVMLSPLPYQFPALTPAVDCLCISGCAIDITAHVSPHPLHLKPTWQLTHRAAQIRLYLFRKVLEIKPGKKKSSWPYRKRE